MRDMLSREQAQALTRTVHLLRPAWSEEGIYAALAKCREHDAFEVALAAIRAAKDKAAQTPGIIPARGSHWNEPDATARPEPRLSRQERRKRTCETCGGLDGCRPPEHEFVSLDHATRDRAIANHHIQNARGNLSAALRDLCSHGVTPANCREPHDRTDDQPEGDDRE